MESVKIDFIQHPLYSRYAAVNDKDTDNKIYDTLKKKFLKEYTYDNGKVRVSIKINDYKFVDILENSFGIDMEYEIRKTFR